MSTTKPVPPTPTPTAANAGRQARLGFRALLFPAFFIGGFVACYLSAFHSPTPHEVPISVVGPTATTMPLRDALQQQTGSGFDVRASASLDEARQAVASRHLTAAYVPPQHSGGPSTVIVASAAGVPAASAAESLLRALSARQNSVLSVVDVRPLPGGDPGGTAAFYFVVACTLAGYLVITVVGASAPDLTPRLRYLMLGAMAVGASVSAYLIGTALGAYPTRLGAAVAIIGLGTLYAFVVGVICRLLQVLTGRGSLFLTVSLFILLNFPSSGAAVPPSMLPAFWRDLHGVWIGAGAAEASTSILYFDGRGVGGDIVRLLGWLVVAVLLLLPAIAWRRRRETAAR